MNLRHEGICSENKKGRKEDAVGRKPLTNRFGVKAAAVLAACLSIMPLAERARAQDNAPAKSAEVAGATDEADEYLKAVAAEESKLAEASATPVPETKPAEPAKQPEKKPVEADIDAAAAMETRDRGATAQTKDQIFSHNLLFSIDRTKDTSYTDPSLSPYLTNVDISGKHRKMSLNNSFDFGAKLDVNEAGSAFSPSIRYRDLVEVDPGVMWFTPKAQTVLFGRLLVRPEINVWRFKGVYYGSVALLGNMPSSVYHSHSVGLGYSQPIGKDFRLRIGGVIGGALSHPAWDDVYLNFSTGISGEIHKMVLLYLMPTFYFAANDPMKTAYIGYYWPKIQDIEAGIQVTKDQWTGRLYGDFGLIGNNYGIYDRYGVRGTRTMSINNQADIDVWGSIGATRWSPQLGGRWDPALMVGATVVFGGKYVNSTNTLNFSHLQTGGTQFAETEFPTVEDPGPYGFGRSGNAAYDVPINETKNRILNSTSFAQFKNSYHAASEEEVILRARFLGAFMQQVAYANDAYDALTTGGFFDSEVKRIAKADHEEIFRYIKEYVSWYENHSVKEKMPDSLKKGIAVCAGIGELQAEYMRANGVDAIVMSVNTPKGPHVITAAQMKDRTMLLDYGNMYSTPEGTLDQTLRFYGQNRQAPVFQSQFFNGKGYMGTYLTSEGRLLHGAVGLENPELLKKDFLGVR
ncbi:hypothetical protein H0O00_03995 [Candidatus Micrarchaeota archaeon]|nr:hypothetical protein [Candidatus Micrarchaeota archaeon]